MQTDKRNSLWLAIQFVISFSIALAVYYLNLSLYKEKLFGAWLILASLWGMGTSLDFGFGLTIIKYVAEYNSGKKEKINDLLSSIFFVFIVLGFLVFIVMYSVAELFYFNNPYIVPADKVNLFKTVFVILGCGFIFQYLILFIRSVFEGLNLFVITSKINLTNNFFLLAGVLVVYNLKLSMVWLSVVYLLAPFLMFLIYVTVALKKQPELKIRFANFNYDIIKQVVKYSVSVQFTSFFTSLIDPVIKYIIGNNYRADFVPVYEIARRTTVAISGLFFAAFKIILPKASVLKNKEDYREFLMSNGAEYTKMGVVYSGFAFGLAVLPVLFLLKYIFKYEEIVPLFLMLSLAEAVNNVGYTIYMFILGIGKAYFVVLVQFINIVIISLSLIAGFALFANPLGLLGYFLTVVMVNIMTFQFVKRQSGIETAVFMNIIHLKKFVWLLMSIGTAIYLLLNLNADYLMVLGGLSVASAFIFRKEFIHYTKYFLSKGTAA